MRKKGSDGRPPVALVNLERVLMDQAGALEALAAKLHDPLEPTSRPGMVDYARELASVRRDLQKTPEFWNRLGLLHDGRWILATLVHLGYAVTIFSEELRGCPDLWGAKMRWCYENLFSGMKDCRFVIGESACFLDADVYVDDRPGQASTWLTLHPSSLAIVPSRPWNSAASSSGFLHSRAVLFERERNASRVEDLLARVERNKPVDTREKCVRCTVKYQAPGEQVCLPCKIQLRCALIWWQRFVLGMTLSEISKEHSVSRERVNQALNRHDEILAKRMRMECNTTGWGRRLIWAGALPPLNIPWHDLVPDSRNVKLPPREEPSATGNDRRLQDGVPAYVSVRKAAMLLRVNVKTIYTAVKDGTLSFIRIGRTIRIPAAALQGVQTR